MFAHCYFSIQPIGTSNPSISNEVTECIKIFKSSGLKYKVSATGTDVEGEFDRIVDAIQRCHKKLHEMGCPRVHSDIKMMTRIDKVSPF